MYRVILASFVFFGLAVSVPAQQPVASERERARELAEAKRKLDLLDATSAQFKTYEKRRQMRQRLLDDRPKPRLVAPGAESGIAAERKRAGYVWISGRGWVNPTLEQQILGAWAVARAANAQQQPSRPGPWASGYGGYPTYSGPFFETISHAGNQTYVNGVGPFGPFSEAISQTGGQTYISGFGMPPYAGVGPGF